jgi:hypothetical protein
MKFGQTLDPLELDLFEGLGIAVSLSAPRVSLLIWRDEGSHGPNAPFFRC